MESIDLNRVIIVLIWLALASGAALSLMGLMQNSRKYSEWKRLKELHDGDILPVDDRLKLGANGTIQPISNSEGKSACSIYTQLTSLDAKSMVISAERDSTVIQHDNSILDELGVSSGNQVNLTLTASNALFRLHTRVLSCEPDLQKQGKFTIRLARPFWMVRIQRRKHVRVPLKADALFDHAEVVDPVPDPIMGQIVDLSGGGVRVDVGRPCSPNEAAELLERYEPGTVLRFRLGLPAFRGTALLARVCTRQRTAIKGGLGVQIACEFMPMASWEQELLISHVFRAEREMLKSRFQSSQPAA